MSDLIKDISESLQKQIEDFQPEFELRDIGNVIEAGDGIARATGLADVQAQELLQFENGDRTRYRHLDFSQRHFYKANAHRPDTLSRGPRASLCAASTKNRSILILPV